MSSFIAYQTCFNVYIIFHVQYWNTAIRSNKLNIIHALRGPVA